MGFKTDQHSVNPSYYRNIKIKQLNTYCMEKNAQHNYIETNQLQSILVIHKQPVINVMAVRELYIQVQNRQYNRQTTTLNT